MINNSVGTHSKISIAKMPRLKKRGKKSAGPHFLAFPRLFFAVAPFPKSHSKFQCVAIYGFPLFPRASERRVLPIVGVCISSSHLHIFSSSHLLIFTSSHFTSSHLHTFSSSHLLIFTSSHLHTFYSLHLLIFAPSQLHIFSSSHLLIFTSSHLHIFSSSHLLSFTSSHLHIFTSSHLHIF